MLMTFIIVSVSVHIMWTPFVLLGIIPYIQNKVHGQVLKAYKYRIYPNNQQKEMFAKHFGCVRHVYNWALAEKKKCYEQTKKSLSRAQLQAMVVKAKKEDKPWLKEVNSQSLLVSLLHLDTAFTNFFKQHAKVQKQISRLAVISMSSTRHDK